MNPLAAARNARGLTLQDIAGATRVSPRHVKAIDEARYHDLPPGVYARSYVRAFAHAVKLDSAALDAVLAALPEPPDPVPFLKAANPRRLDNMAALATLQLCGAVITDALLLMGVSAVITGVVAAACGVTGGELVRSAPVPVFVLCASTWVEYFVLLAGIHGRTAGDLLWGLPGRGFEAPLNLTIILQRAAYCPARVHG